MSAENTNPVPATESNTPSRPSPGPIVSDRIKQQQARVVWWVKLFLQPLLTIAAIVTVIIGFGVAQQFGLFTSSDQAEADSENTAEDVQYICPMVCVPPSSEPGKCPVCGMKLKAKKSSGDAKDKYGIRLDQASIRVANIRTVKAEAKPLIRQLRTIGRISYDEGSLATISAYVDGRIEKLFADYTGVKVAEGDELALLYSPDLFSSQVALLESLKLMRNSKSTSQRIDNSNRRLYESSRQRLIELGLTKNQVDQLEKNGKADSRIRIVSPIAGTVIEKLADKGQYVKTGQAIYKVADLSNVWLMLELFPKDAANIGFGQKVTTKIQSLPGKEFIGRVAFIDPTVDSKTQTVRVRVVVPNENGVIRVGDFATASIFVSANATGDQKAVVYDPDLVGKWISPRHLHVISDGPGVCTECGMDLVPTSDFGFASAPITEQHNVVVPRDAVLMAGENSVVFVETEPGRFEFRKVEVGQIVGDSVSLVSGVKQGEMVANDPYLLDSAFSMSNKPSLIDPYRAIPREAEIIDEFNTPEVIAALAELSEADRLVVKLQKICPVTVEPLGSMGVPLPVDVDGQTIWICCDGCRDGLLKEPQKYLDILANGPPAAEPEPTELPQITPLGNGDLPQMELPKMKLPN